MSGKVAKEEIGREGVLQGGQFGGLVFFERRRDCTGQKIPAK